MATAAEYPGEIAWNNTADAFRHGYWNYRMTQDLGVDAAKFFADAHERYSANRIGETLMDLHNNSVGRNLASTPGFSGTPSEVIRKATDKGMFRTRPYNEMVSCYTIS